MNQLFRQLNQSLKSPSSKGGGNPMVNFLKQKYQECMMMANPAAYILKMAEQNPNVRQVLTMAQQNGGDMKQLFYKLAESKGVDPESVLNTLK